MHKTLGGDTHKPDYPSWPRGYCILYGVMLSNKAGGEGFSWRQSLFLDWLSIGLHVGRGAESITWLWCMFFPPLFSFLHFLNCL